VPNHLVPMTVDSDAASAVPADSAAPRRPASTAPAKASTGKMSAAASWAEWRATRSADSANVFCESVLSWLEGASAQLVRPLWPAGGVRPTAMEVQARLRKGLAVVVAEEADYVKGLDAARRKVAAELSKQRARDLLAG